MPPAAPAPALAYRASFSGDAGFIPQNFPAFWQFQGIPPTDPRKRDAATPPDGAPAAKRRVTSAEQMPGDPRRYALLPAQIVVDAWWCTCLGNASRRGVPAFD